MILTFRFSGLDRAQLADVDDAPDGAGAAVVNEQASIPGAEQACGAVTDLAIFGDERGSLTGTRRRGRLRLTS